MNLLESESLSRNICRAVLYHEAELLKTLLVNATCDDLNDDSLPTSALDIAVQECDYTAAKLLLDHGALPDHKLSERSTTDFDNWQWRIKDSIDPETLLRNESLLVLFGYKFIKIKSTLYWAILRENYDIVKLLIDRGCNPDSYPDCWYNVINRNNLPIFKFLMECTGREVGNNEWCQEMMLIACGIGSNNIVFYLIDEGVPVDIQLHGLTGAFRASLCNKHDTVMQLAERGANLNFIDPNGLSLLHAAVGWDSISFIQFLLDSGLDVNIRDMYNRTPLHYAVKNLVFNYVSRLLDLLVSRGADINAIDILGQTPIMKAIDRMDSVLNTYSHAADIIYRLSQHKNTDFVKQDNEGHSVLHHLVMKDLFIGPDPLLRPEIDINARNKKNMTLLQYAMEYTSLRYFKALLELSDEFEGLIEYSDTLVRRKEFITVLARFRAKRRIAGFNEDENINFILSKQKILDLKTVGTLNTLEEFEQQIEIMKNEKLFGRINYFNFLHAKRQTCVKIAEISDLREIFFSKSREFGDYFYMLAKKYVNGLKPLTKQETKALMFVEDNLSVISNYLLPSTVTYKIKKYIDIKDMITLLNMNLFESNDNDDDDVKV